LFTVFAVPKFLTICGRGQRNAVSRLGTKGNGQYNCGGGRGSYGWCRHFAVGGRRNGKRTVVLLNNSRNENINLRKKTRKTVPVCWVFKAKRMDRQDTKNDYALNTGPQCVNKYYTFMFIVLTCRYILYYYIPHYHIICIFIILAKHNFGRKAETINLSFYPGKYIFFQPFIVSAKIFLS